MKRRRDFLGTTRCQRCFARRVRLYGDWPRLVTCAACSRAIWREDQAGAEADEAAAIADEAAAEARRSKLLAAIMRRR